MRTHPAGPHALLVECADGDEVAGWLTELSRRRDNGELSCVELVPAARTVLLDGVDDPAALGSALAGWTPMSDSVRPAETTSVEVPCVYDGPDLADVAELWGTSTDGVVQRHTDTWFRVAFCGFSPGFGYLTGLPPELAVARRPSPRSRVPTGSVGLAGEYSGIYPSPSPGGWQLIGRTELVLFDPAAQPPALLAPGTPVRFRAVQP